MKSLKTLGTWLIRLALGLACCVLTWFILARGYMFLSETRFFRDYPFAAALLAMTVLFGWQVYGLIRRVNSEG